MRIPPTRTDTARAGAGRSTAAPRRAAAGSDHSINGMLLLACLLLLSAQLGLAAMLTPAQLTGWLPPIQILGWVILGAVACRLLPLAARSWTHWRQRQAETRAAARRLAQARGNRHLMAEITFAHMRRALEHEPVLGNEEARYGFYIGDEQESQA